VRIGAYVDGFNLYYGGRSLCGRGTPGWRWLDIRALLNRHLTWSDSHLAKITYCTAVIDAATNASGYHDQDIYLRALRAAKSVDHIEFGTYVARVKQSPLAVRASVQSGRPEVVHPQWPIVVQDAQGKPIPDAVFMVSYAHREEKGSDVNVASHLLVDVLTSAVDAAIVVSNDSDLKFPVKYARTRVPVGLINPSDNPTAGALRGKADDGVGGHWWRTLTADDLRGAQLPEQVEQLTKPPGW
jgi:uncharacterized LabA/DUF88 family protein